MITRTIKDLEIERSCIRERMLRRETDIVLTRMKRYVTEYFGPRCEEFDAGCACCGAWKHYDAFEKYVRGVWS
jgi:hypothetical protein